MLNIFEEKGYTHIKHLSSGGEGDVHIITKDSRLYIAKVFNRLNQSNVELLNHIKEIKAPNVPEIYDIFNHDGKTILIRDYIDGDTLFEVLQKKGKMDLERAKTIIFKVCETIEAFHNIQPSPIIHRDLKPENIMISKNGDVFLIDFGISRYYKDEVTRDTVLAGTKGYTAPEILAGMQSDKRSDIYSIGLILYEMLTGKNLLEPPYQIRPVRETNESIPKWMDDIIEKATGLSMVSRYKDINEFVDNLRNPRKFRIEKRHIVIAAIFITVVAGSIFGFRFYQSFKAQQSHVANIAMAEEEISSDTYQVILDLQFNDSQDANWFEILGENADSIDGEACVGTGVFTLKEQIQLKQSLEMGEFIHIQFVAPDFEKDGAMFMMDLTSRDWSETLDFQCFRFYFGNNQPNTLGVNRLTDYSTVWQKKTSFMMRSNMRVDVILWLDEQDHSLRYLFSDADNPSRFGYLGVVMEETWQDESWNFGAEVDTGFWGGAVPAQDLYTDIEFLVLSSGSINAYMAENLPAYVMNKDSIDALMKNSMTDMDDLVRYQYDE